MDRLKKMLELARSADIKYVRFTDTDGDEHKLEPSEMIPFFLDGRIPLREVAKVVEQLDSGNNGQLGRLLYGLYDEVIV